MKIISREFNGKKLYLQSIRDPIAGSGEVHMTEHIEDALKIRPRDIMIIQESFRSFLLYDMGQSCHEFKIENYKVVTSKGIQDEPDLD